MEEVKLRKYTNTPSSYKGNKEEYRRNTSKVLFYVPNCICQILTESNVNPLNSAKIDKKITDFLQYLGIIFSAKLYYKKVDL